MNKKPKNIPSPYKSTGTPIYRDTTALPFLDGGPLVDKTNHGDLLPSVYASALGNYYAQGGIIKGDPVKTIPIGDTIVYPPGDSEYMNQPPLNFDIIEKEDYEYRKGYDNYLEYLRNQPKKKTAEYYMTEPLRLAQNGGFLNSYKAGGNLIKRADGSYSPRGLWDNIRANRGSGKEPTKEMLAQEKKINKQYKKGGPLLTSLTPEEEKQFQKFYQSLPDNLMSDDPTYDIRGYWDSEGRPETFDYSQPKEDDGYYHAYSISGKTGEYLKSPAHETFQHAVDIDRTMGYRPVTNVYGRNIVTENESIKAPEKTHFLNNTVGPVNFRTGGQFPRPYSLPEDNFKQGGDNLHNSVYASSSAQYPGIYKYGGSFDMPRQQMYMPLDNVERYGGNIYREGGSVFYATNTAQLEGEGKDLTYPDGAYVYGNGGVIKTSHLFAEGGPVFPTNQQLAQFLNPEYQRVTQGQEVTVRPNAYQMQQAKNKAAGINKYDAINIKPQVAESTKPNIAPVDKKVLDKAIVQKTAERKVVAKEIKNSPLLTQEQKQEILMSPKKLDENAYLAYQKKPEILKATKEYSAADKTVNILRNPLVAASYFMKPGAFNMPMNYSELERSPNYSDETWNKNAVGQGINFASYFNPTGLMLHTADNALYTASDLDKALESGKSEDWKQAGLSAANTALDLVGSRYIGNSGRLLNAGEQATLNAMNTSNRLGLNPSVNTYLGTRVFPNISSSVVRSADDIAAARLVPQINPNNINYNPLARNLYNNAVTAGNVQNTLEASQSSPWTMQEMPGLHLKSTMSNGAVSKIVEPKTGLINIEQALGIIGKESGGADKVALIKQGLGEPVPKKMDYNEFRKTVQDQLIPLERQFVDYASDYGINRLGYKEPEFITRNINGKTVNEMTSDVIENQTLILSNKNKFGRGSNAHSNPEETLGHIHFLIDAETPDVLTATQIQSDAFQGTHRVMPKVFNKEQELRGLSMMEDKLKARELDYSKAKKLPNGDYKFDDGLVMDKTLYEQGLTVQKEMNAMKKADIESYTQKSLLDKNHQERFLQELVNYAGERGDVNKLRLPTSETAAKVQGYSKNTATGMDEMGLPTDLGYSLEHQTILKKYSEQPKTIKKLFGVEPRIVTDNKGNTWYEFDIPEGFKGTKGEIKAFSMGGFITTEKQFKTGGQVRAIKSSDLIR